MDYNNFQLHYTPAYGVLRRCTATNRHVIFSSYAIRFSGEFINQRRILAARALARHTHPYTHINPHKHITHVYNTII